MATTYYEDVAASDLSLGGSFTHVLTPTQPGSTSSDSLSASSGGGTDTGHYVTPSGDPGAGGVTGAYNAKINVTANQSGVTIGLTARRVNSSGAVQASAGMGTDSSGTTGVKSFTTSATLGTWAAGDRLDILVTVTNTNAHGGAKGATWETGGTNDFVSAPWTGAITHSDSPAGIVSLAGSVVDSYAISDAPSGAIGFAGSVFEEYVPPGASFNDSVSGTLGLAGSASDQWGIGFNDSPGGLIAFSGSLSGSHTASDSSTGIVSLSGSRSESRSATDAAVGVVSLSGAVTESASQSSTDTPSGMLFLSGSLVGSRAFSDAVFGAFALTGSATESFSPGGVIYTDSPSGVILFSGLSVISSSRTSSPSGAIMFVGERIEASLGASDFSLSPCDCDVVTISPATRRIL